MSARARSSMLGESGYERLALDKYYTESWCVDALLNWWHPSDALTIWEPCAGRGDIVSALEGRGYRVVASDIEPAPPIRRACKGPIEHVDFRQAWWTDERFMAGLFAGVGAIVTNPPYQSLDEWLEMFGAWRRRNGGSAALLLRNEADSAAARRKFFAGDPDFAMKIVLTRRPRWILDGGAVHEGNPRHNFAWFVWGVADPAEARPLLRYAP